LRSTQALQGTRTMSEQLLPGPVRIATPVGKAGSRLITCAVSGSLSGALGPQVTAAAAGEAVAIEMPLVVSAIAASPTPNLCRRVRMKSPWLRTSVPMGVHVRSVPASDASRSRWNSGSTARGIREDCTTPVVPQKIFLAAARRDQKGDRNGFRTHLLVSGITTTLPCLTRYQRMPSLSRSPQTGFESRRPSDITHQISVAKRAAVAQLVESRILPPTTSRPAFSSERAWLQRATSATQHPDPKINTHAVRRPEKSHLGPVGCAG
jgi:hypothetical protein